MAEVKISDFTMLEKPPYKLPSVKPMIELIVKGSAKEEEKMYGPVFRDLYIKCALYFVAKKFGEAPKEEIKTLEQPGEFLVSISDRRPDAFNAVVYAGLKAESDLQGRSGAGVQVGSIAFSRKVERTPNAKERNVNIDQLLATYQKTLLQLEVAYYELGYRKNSDESVDLIWPSCHMKDACRMVYDEGMLGRTIGGLQCVSCTGICQFFKQLSGYDWDYELLEFDKPHCLARLFMI